MAFTFNIIRKEAKHLIIREQLTELAVANKGIEKGHQVSIEGRRTVILILTLFSRKEPVNLAKWLDLMNKQAGFIEGGGGMVKLTTVL